MSPLPFLVLIWSIIAALFQKKKRVWTSVCVCVSYSRWIVSTYDGGGEQRKQQEDGEPQRKRNTEVRACWDGGGGWVGGWDKWEKDKGSEKRENNNKKEGGGRKQQVTAYSSLNATDKKKISFLL